MADLVAFEPNDQQREAIAAAVAWYQGWARGDHKQQVFFLAGFAGTGKTTVARYIADLCVPADRCVFIAPTGKAASRLRAKGCEGAMTLHKFVYLYRGDNEDKEPIFVARGELERYPLLVVMDESSMVGERANEDLLQHGIPVLALGDIGQIPPVKAKAVYTEASVNVLLTEIMRQEAESNIVKASMIVRKGKRLPTREYEDVRIRDGEIPEDDFREHLAEDAQMLCSKNKTREGMNARARRMLGFSGKLPMVGEKIVCVFNQHRFDFFNGEVGIVQGYLNDTPEARQRAEELGREKAELKAELEAAYDARDSEQIEIVKQDLKECEAELRESSMRVTIRSLTDGRVLSPEFNPLCFDDNRETREEYRKGIGGWDFGYALTIHKSQGSEWPKVLVKEEILYGTPYDKLMYTAVTRAIDRLTIYRA